MLLPLLDRSELRILRAVEEVLSGLVLVSRRHRTMRTAFVRFVVPTAFMNALLMPLAFGLMQRALRALGSSRQLEL